MMLIKTAVFLKLCDYFQQEKCSFILAPKNCLVMVLLTSKTVWFPYLKTEALTAVCSIAGFCDWGQVEGTAEEKDAEAEWGENDVGPSSYRLLVQRWLSPFSTHKI